YSIPPFSILLSDEKSLATSSYLFIQSFPCRKNREHRSVYWKGGNLMSDMKMRLELHDFLNRDGICRHLEKMAEKGWLLEKMGGLMWTYRRISPQKLKFSLYYSSTADAENAESMEKQ